MTFLYLAGALALALVAFKFIRKPFSPGSDELNLWHWLGLIAMAFSAHYAARFCERTFGWAYELMFFIFIVTPLVVMIGALIYRTRKTPRKIPKEE